MIVCGLLSEDFITKEDRVKKQKFRKERMEARKFIE